VRRRYKKDRGEEGRKGGGEERKWRGGNGRKGREVVKVVKFTLTWMEITRPNEHQSDNQPGRAWKISCPSFVHVMSTGGLPVALQLRMMSSPTNWTTTGMSHCLSIEGGSEEGDQGRKWKREGDRRGGSAVYKKAAMAIRMKLQC